VACTLPSTFGMMLLQKALGKVLSTYYNSMTLVCVFLSLCPFTTCPIILYVQSRVCFFDVQDIWPDIVVDEAKGHCYVPQHGS
jgi:hypothetical protein